MNIENILYLDSIEIFHEQYRDRGLGSAGIDMIKELANSLHFTEIKGRREPKTDDKEAYLFGKFYEKNGFEQNPDNAYFRYDMKNYAHTPCDQN